MVLSSDSTQRSPSPQADLFRSPVSEQRPQSDHDQ